MFDKYIKLIFSGWIMDKLVFYKLVAPPLIK